MLKNITKSLLAFLVSATMGVLTGCISIEEKPDQVRFLGEPSLHADMKRMAKSLRIMAELVIRDEKSDLEQQRVVLTELDKIQSTARSIGGDDVITNYSVINQYMGAFLYDVQLAKMFAEKSPPNLVPANRLLNSCLSCHRSM